MKPLAFISHSESGGQVTSNHVINRLRHKRLNLDPFYSQINIRPGDDLHEEIIRGIVNTDILIGVIDLVAADSGWVAWEHNFCKERNLSPIPIIFESVWDDFINNRISFLDNGIIGIFYDFYIDKMLDKLYTTIQSKKEELIKRIEEKEKITINLHSINSSYQDEDTITISGKVDSVGMPPFRFTVSKIYLHRRNFDSEENPVISKTLNDEISLDDNGNFSYDCKISDITKIDRHQKWFFEIRFDNKSEILTTAICLPDTSGGPASDTSSGGPASDSFSRIQEKIQTLSSGTFSSISKKIGNYSIDRKKEVLEIIKNIRKQDKIVLTGNKGSGKSVILCELYQQLKDSDDVLFIRCDDYLHIQNLSELEKILFEDKSLYDIIQENYSSTNKLFVFFDSLDAISRNSRVFEIFKQFLKQLWGTDKIKTVCSVRSYDYQYSHSITTTDWGRNFNLNELSDEQLNQVLEYLKKPQISGELFPILKNPLNLKLLSLILDKSSDSDFRAITSEIDLYNEHWKEYVEKSEEPSTLKNTLFFVSKEMIKQQQTTITTPDDCSHSGLILSLSSSLLEKEPDTNVIQFFHHAYLDYVASRYLLENFENLDEFIVKQKYNIFLRPTIVFTFSILQMKNQELFLKNVKRLLLNEEVKYYWKLSVLHVFSSFKTDDPNKVKTFGELFNEDLYLRQHFLRESMKSNNSFWFEVWKDSFIQTWANQSQINNRFLLDYLKSVINLEIDHSKLFEILKIIVDVNYDEWTKKTALEIASVLNVEKSDWYLSLSNHSSSYVRWGVVESLLNLIEGGTKDLNKVLSNIFLFKEGSDDKTFLPSGGSLVMQSNKKQDNRQVIWVASELFNKLLEKDPAEFIHSAATIIEDEQKNYLNQEGTVIEDGGSIWYESGLDRLHKENKILSDIETFLRECDKEKLKELVSILTLTRLATLHKIAIDAMLRKSDNFKNEILSELLIPEIYKIETLENTVRYAIEKISSILLDEEIQSILNLIMEISFPDSRLDEPTTKKYIELHQAKFLSSIPIEKLTSEQKELLERHSKEELKTRPKRSFEFEPFEESYAKEKKSPKEIIDSTLGKSLEHRPKIELLSSIIEYLGSKTEELDDAKFSTFKDFLLTEVSNEDPKSDSEDKDSSIMGRDDTVRGLVSRCLIRLYYHTKDEELIKHIEKLADDSINIVRGEVAYELRYLYFVNPSLTLKIVTKYSQESDHRVQFFLSDIVSVLAHKHPQETIDIIKNIIKVNNSKDGQFIQFYDGIIVYLSLIKQNQTAKSLLNDLITNPELPDEYKENLPFILKESYLYNESTQDEALEIFSTFLDSKNHLIREKATFFLLVTLDDKKTSEVKKIIDKIGPHLDKIAKEIEREKWDLRIIEELIKFLEKNWMYIPEKSIEYLQRISKENKKYLEFQSWIASGTIMILNGLFREGTLTDENKQHCLDVLDKFVMVGWPKALELLSSMERPD